MLSLGFFLGSAAVTGVVGAFVGMVEGKERGVVIFEESLEKVKRRQNTANLRSSDSLKSSNKINIESYINDDISLLMLQSNKSNKKNVRTVKCSEVLDTNNLGSLGVNKILEKLKNI